MSWKIENKDYELSPYTGITRRHWLDACQYLINGVFSYVHDYDSPILFPRQDTKYTYPNDHTPAWKEQAEIFEGLTRTFFVAAPLIRCKPEAKGREMLLKEYYKKQILMACTVGSPNYVYSFEDLKRMEVEHDPFACYQQTVECAALAIGLWISEKEIWSTYTDEEKETILKFIQTYAYGNTSSNNWRMFNMLMLAFLYRNGCPIDEGVMRDHAQVILSYYVGDGWYRDANCFDYYSAWAFQLYAPIWNVWYGYEKEPYLAQQFEEHSNALMNNYPQIFDRDGWVTMWGRSAIYRNGATVPLISNFLLGKSRMDPGYARRIASGALIQFLTRDDVFYQGIPCLGFYRYFLPIVQDYSCAESPFWMGKVMIALVLDEEHPFWTEKEKNGIWEEEKQTIYEQVLPGPGLVYTNNIKNGMVELRSGKVLRHSSDLNGLLGYAKLSYCSKYPAESIKNEGIESQMYTLKNCYSDTYSYANAVFYGGIKKGVFYRHAVFGFRGDLKTEGSMELADIPISYGLLRVDKMRIHDKPMELTLGSYGFAKKGNSQIRTMEIRDGEWKAIVLSDGQSCLAMTFGTSFDETGVYTRQGCNPVSQTSHIIYGKVSRNKQYEYRPYILISCMQMKEDGKGFTNEELFPVKEVQYTDKEQCGGYGPVKIILKDDTSICVNYDGLEGRLQV